jgi:hypothetical protein
MPKELNSCIDFVSSSSNRGVRSVVIGLGCIVYLSLSF